ncbi:MAG TPA: dihydroxyacetone kinase subunit L [Planctomycetaceae bacterium]|nr:dihydroxyacetone kinase subunit L [Planctomycetaceae bacterium]|tara:strand:+ start:2652 stop:3287 length:636 start_codon:yes stop_codon:yes gene_type:complete
MDIPIRELIDAISVQLQTHAEELTDLDRAIGDGDHGINMARGWNAVVAARAEIASLPPGAALEKIGMTLVMNVGGASGPLFGSLFMGLGKHLGDNPGFAEFRNALRVGIELVQQRGRSTAGEKTMLDVFVPLVEMLETFDPGGGTKTVEEIITTARCGMESTQAMLATKGRAAFLGERSVGHVDPGAMSSYLIIETVCNVIIRNLARQESS